jgi:hypothetical protein
VKRSNIARSIARSGCDSQANSRVRMPSANRRMLCPSVGALLIVLGACNTTNNRLVEETFERLYTIEPSANITIQNGDGAVLVYGSSVNDMRVRAVKKAYRRARLTQIAIDVSMKPGAVFITTKFPPKPKWGLFDRSGTVDYTIVLPATATISGVDLDAGEILLDGMQGPTTRARLGKGRIFARNCFTNLDIAMRRGNLILSYDWWEESKFSAHTNVAQGNAWAYLPGDAAFHLLAKAAHGKIFNDFENAAVAAPASAAGMKTDTLVNGGGKATIKMRVAEGNIKIVEANP